MRFISAQFEALLSNDLWRQNAQHANHMAQLLASELGKIPQVRITQKVESNGVFAEVPKGKYIPVLQKQYFFFFLRLERRDFGSQVHDVVRYDRGVTFRTLSRC